MNVEYINAFIKASNEVLKTSANMDFKTGTPYVKQNPFETNNLVIIVGITGEIRGQAVISMSLKMAKTVASNMMMGMPVEEIDEIAKSALSELGNMIMGNAATLIYNTGVAIDITPPTLMIGEKMQISSSDMQVVGVPLHCSDGDVTIDVSMEK